MTILEEFSINLGQSLTNYIGVIYHFWVASLNYIKSTKTLCLDSWNCQNFEIVCYPLSSLTEEAFF